jgi:hypothetical protein
VDSEHENSKMNHFLQLGKSTFAGQNVLLRRKSSMMASSPNKPVSNETQKEPSSSPQRITIASSEKKHDASVLSKVLEENNNTNSAQPAMVSSSSSSTSSSPYREPSKTAFTKSLLTTPAPVPASSAASSSSSVNKMFPAVTSSSSASSVATKSNPIVEKPKKIDLMTPALKPAPVTTKEQVKPSAVVEIPVEKNEEKKLPSVTAVEIKPVMGKETMRKQEVIIPAVVKQESVAVEMKLEITNMKEVVENKEQSEHQRQNDVNNNQEPIVVALQSQASESLPTPAPAPPAPSSSPLRLLSTSNDEPTGEGEKGDKVQFFSLQSLAAPVSNKFVVSVSVFFLSFSQTSDKPVDLEHENNKLNHFLQLGKASLVSDGPGSLLAGGRGGRGAILRRKSSLLGTSSSPNNKPLSSPKADLSITPMKPKEVSQQQQHPATVYRAFSDEVDYPSVHASSTPFASSVSISVERKEVAVHSSSSTEKQKTSSVHQLFGSIVNNTSSSSSSINESQIEIHPETEEKKEEWKEPVVETKLYLKESHVAPPKQSNEQQHGLTPLKSIPRIDSAGLNASKSHDSVENEDGEKMQFFSLKSLKSSVSSCCVFFLSFFSSSCRRV